MIKSIDAEVFLLKIKKCNKNREINENKMLTR